MNWHLLWYEALSVLSHVLWWGGYSQIPRYTGTAIQVVVVLLVGSVLTRPYDVADSTRTGAKQSVLMS